MPKVIWYLVEDHLIENSSLQPADGLHLLNTQLCIREAWLCSDLGYDDGHGFAPRCQVSEPRELRAQALAGGEVAASWPTQ